VAARLRKTHQDDVRTKIQATQLIKRLTDHALGTLEKEMSATQVTAALGLLKKSVPDLTATEHTGSGGGPVEHQIEMVIVDATDRSTP